MAFKSQILLLKLTWYSNVLYSQIVICIMYKHMYTIIHTYVDAPCRTSTYVYMNIVVMYITTIEHYMSNENRMFDCNEWQKLLSSKCNQCNFVTIILLVVVFLLFYIYLLYTHTHTHTRTIYIFVCHLTRFVFCILLIIRVWLKTFKNTYYYTMRAHFEHNERFNNIYFGAFFFYCNVNVNSIEHKLNLRFNYMKLFIL